MNTYPIHAREEVFLFEASTGDEAFYHGTRAAELLLEAMESSASSKERSMIREEFNKVVRKLEQIKEVGRTRAHFSSGDRTKGCVFESPMAKCYPQDTPFPLWEAPKSRWFQTVAGEALFKDNTDFALSVEQLGVFDCWRRPDEIFQCHAGIEDPDQLFMRPAPNSDLVQDITTDCSVVASLCAAMRILRHGSRSILSHIMFPLDSSSTYPTMSPSGRHVFRLFFNGHYRQVIIDNRLPCSRSQRSLYVVDQEKPSLIWPALLEKAYLKVRGGYDFPGSDTGTDLFVLTGWIPEQQFLQSGEFDLQTTWDRIQVAHKSGDVLITLGTGKVDPSIRQSLGLVPEHAYAVLDLMTIDNGDRYLLIKDPWRDQCRVRPRQGALRTGAPNRSAAFWVPAHETLINFESMFFNWNPKLFTHRKDLHFSWSPPPHIFSRALIYHRQFSLNITHAGVVWILLNRHFPYGKNDALNTGQSSVHSLHSRGFISIAVFRANGRRIYADQGALYKSSSVSSLYTLAKVYLEPGCYMIIPMHKDPPLVEYSYSLTMLSPSPLEACRIDDDGSFNIARLGAWTRRTAGGNANSGLYKRNPQFNIQVKDTTDITLVMVVEIADIPARVDLTWSRGGPTKSLDQRDLIAHSGDYEHGCSMVKVSLEPGAYNIICSTFSPGQLARFALCVSASHFVAIQETSNEFSGNLHCKLPPLVFTRGHMTKRIQIRPTRLTRLMVRAYLNQANNCSVTYDLSATVMLSVIYGWNPNQRVVATSSDETAPALDDGIATNEFDVHPADADVYGLWLLIEAKTHQLSHCALDVDVTCDHQVNFEQWETC